MVSCKWCMCILVALFSVFTSTTTTCIQNSKLHSDIIIVNPSGQGDFRTIQSAIDSVPSNNQRWIRIDIKAGIYSEQVKIPRDKQFIYLNGEGRLNTSIVWNLIDAQATSAFEANNTLAKDITFANSYNDRSNKSMARAVAARIEGDKLAFFRCGFVSLQDTLWDNTGRHFFKECVIQGAVDFIYGAGQSIYEICTISVTALSHGAGYVTAQGRGIPQDTSGFVFKNCKIIGNGMTYLGRPWRPYARVIFYKTQMSDVVVPQGWDAWFSKGREYLLTFSENKSSGPGARMSERVSWEKKLSEEEVKQFTSISYIDNNGWVMEALHKFG